MSLIKLPNGEFLNETVTAYPSPELLIKTIRDISSIQYLSKNESTVSNGEIYFYVNGDMNDPFFYIGETAVSILTRNRRHSKKGWTDRLVLPHIGTVKSIYKPLEADTRRTIEALIIFELAQLGFTPINAENKSWKDGVVIPTNVEEKYVRDFANIVVDNIVFLAGTVPSRKTILSSSYTTLPTTDSSNSQKSEVSYIVDVVVPFVSETEIIPIKEKYKNIPRVSIESLVKRGYISTGSILAPNSSIYKSKATVTDDYKLMVNGKKYDSLSAAGMGSIHHANSTIRAVSGWDFWSLENTDGTLKKMSSIREDFLNDNIIVEPLKKKSLKDLVKAGIIKPNTEIVTLGYKYNSKATIVQGGRVKIGNHEVDSLTAAGTIAMQESGADGECKAGWTFWGRKAPDGVIIPLSVFR